GRLAGSRPERSPGSRTERLKAVPSPGAALLAGRDDRDHPAAAPAVELHGPRPGGEDRVVLADAGAVAGLEAGAALTRDDLAGARAASLMSVISSRVSSWRCPLRTL